MMYEENKCKWSDETFERLDTLQLEIENRVEESKFTDKAETSLYRFFLDTISKFISKGKVELKLVQIPGKSKGESK